jgi:hypothetical protein
MPKTYDTAETAAFTEWLVAELTERYAPAGQWASFFVASPLDAALIRGAVEGEIRYRAREGFDSLWDDLDADTLCWRARDTLLIFLGLPRADTWREEAEVLSREKQR